jgi:hypothetical protein
MVAREELNPDASLFRVNRWGRTYWSGLLRPCCRQPQWHWVMTWEKLIGTVLRIRATRASRPAEYLNGKHPLKERPVTLKRDTQVFGRYVVAFIPLLLQLRPSVGEALRQPVDSGRDQSISFVNGISRLIDKTGLDLIPVALQLLTVFFDEKRNCVTLGLSFCWIHLASST